METIKLQFQTPQDFKGFRLYVQDNVIEFSISDLTVTCNCEMGQIAEAINKFGGLVVKK